MRDIERSAKIDDLIKSKTPFMFEQDKFNNKANIPINFWTRGSIEFDNSKCNEKNGLSKDEVIKKMEQSKEMIYGEKGLKSIADQSNSIFISFYVNVGVNFFQIPFNWYFFFSVFIPSMMNDCHKKCARSIWPLFPITSIIISCIISF